MKLTKFLSKILNSFRLIGLLRHKYYIRAAWRVYKKLHEIAEQHPDPNVHFPKLINYLRKLNKSPFVFEELILSVIEHSNVRVIRNLAYTGDGGIDGRFKLPEGVVLVQCKCYTGYIDNKHVTDLAQKVKQLKCAYGIFVHTGKTGELSKTVAYQHGNIMYISGPLLLDFIFGRKLMADYLAKKIKTMKEHDAAGTRPPAPSFKAIRKSSASRKLTSSKS